MENSRSSYDATGQQVAIRRVQMRDCDEFIALAQAGRQFHLPWMELPTDRERFEKYLHSRQSTTDDGFVICELASHHIAGVINLNCIVRGCFHSAYLGYWIGAPYARRGYMTQAMRLMARYAFEVMKLHRLEANIQPDNHASIALVRRLGFRKEGFSPRYLHICGQWRDHERWALLAEDAEPAQSSAR